MEQVFFAGHYDLLYNFGTEYNGLPGGSTWSAAEFIRSQLVSTSGKIKNLRVELDNAPGAGTSYDFTLLVNGAPSALTVHIHDTDTSGNDVVNEIDVVAGNAVCLQCVPTGVPTARYARWTMMFEGSTAKESLILGTLATSSGLPLGYAQLSQSTQSALEAVENNTRQICPTSGKIKNLYVRLSEDPGTAPDAYRFTLRVNGVSSALTVTIIADNTTGNDIVNEITVAADDALTLLVEPLNTPSAEPNVNFGMTFVADIDGESLILGGSPDDLSAADTEYNQLMIGWLLRSWIGTESQRYQLGQACTLRKLYIVLSGAPGAGKSYTFTVREAGDTAITVTIADAATTGNDIVNTHLVADGDEVALKCVPAGTPDVRDAYWGLVGYIAAAPPPAGLENKSANMGSKMVGAGLI